MSTNPSPFQDHAAPILQAEPTITDQQRADLWDAFHTKNSAELVQHLTPLAIPDDLKHKLFQAKQASTPAVPPVDKVTEAVRRVAALEPEVLEKAESHPNVLKAFTTAATTPEKAPAVENGTPASKTGGTQAAASKKAPAAPQEPRADGQPHFPPIPDGHHRILASDGGVHDIPIEQLGNARKIDPLLHVLNP